MAVNDRAQDRCAGHLGYCAAPIGHRGSVRNADQPLTQRAARRYLGRLVGLHLAAVLVCVGFFVAAAGAPAVGVAAIAAGGLLWVALVVWAGVEAARMREPGDRWCGPRSTLADTNRLTGWWYLDEAAEVLGASPDRVRTLLRASVTGCVVALVGMPIVGALSSDRAYDRDWDPGMDSGPESSPNSGPPVPQARHQPLGEPGPRMRGAGGRTPEV